MILVTGSTGLVGAHLLYNLVLNNEPVRALYRREKTLQNVKHVFATYTNDVDTPFNAIAWFKADILDIPALTEAFKGVRYVYHCAAFVSFEPDKYQLLRKTNIEGTANMVNLSIANNVKKLCYVSSIAALGEELNRKPITENSAWNTETDHSVYAITKYGGEMEVWRGTQEGLNAVIVNPGVILGAGIWNYGSGSLFKRAKRGISYYTLGTVGIVAIDDVVRIMITLMTSDIVNEKYILVAENWTYKRFLQTLAQSVKGKLPQKIASKKLLGFAWRLDWIKHLLTGKNRVLSKHMAQSLSAEMNYSSKKIQNTLNYTFKPIEETVKYIGNLYLNDCKEP